jgi:DNA-directed RNA polymerase subunit M/transcription elongation factor TFIIS
MESSCSNSSSYVSCTVCQTRTKRQVIGSNNFYYCRNCGYLSSEANISKETNELYAQKPSSVHKISSVMGHKLSEDSQRTVIETTGKKNVTTNIEEEYTF